MPRTTFNASNQPIPAHLLSDRMVLYKDGGAITHQCADEAEREQKIAEDWYETPHWHRNPRPHGLSQDNPYERRVDTPYQEFPCHVHKAGGKYLVCNSEEEKDAALKSGWSEKPVLEDAKPKTHAARHAAAE